MAWTDGVTRATGYVVTSANWNEQVGATGSLMQLKSHAHGGTTGEGSTSPGPLVLEDFTDASAPAAPGASKTRLYSTSALLRFRAGASGADVALQTIPADVQLYTTTGANTWTKPTVATPKWVRVILIGAGGGAQPGYPNTSSAGGGGGGGGAYVVKDYDPSALGATETVTVGVGGTGGTPSVAGGATTFGSHLTAFGGGGETPAGGAPPRPPCAGGGGGGSASVGAQGANFTTVAGGSPRWSSTIPTGRDVLAGAGGAGDSGNAGGNAAFGGGGGGGGSTLNNGGSSLFGAGGGGSGGTSTPTNGGAGGAYGSYVAGGGGAGGGTGANGTAGTSRSGTGKCGDGGGGGGGNNAGNGGNGANGGAPGGGGGGGGCGTLGGTGAAGARGEAIVITYF